MNVEPIHGWCNVLASYPIFKISANSFDSLYDCEQCLQIWVLQPNFGVYIQVLIATKTFANNPHIVLYYRLDITGDSFAVGCRRMSYLPGLLACDHADIRGILCTPA